jgi:hypothetical protein
MKGSRIEYEYGENVSAFRCRNKIDHPKLSGEKGRRDGHTDPNHEKYSNASWASTRSGTRMKVNPFIIIKPAETITLAEIDGREPYAFFMTPTVLRISINRIYGDDERLLRLKYR